MKIQNEHIPVMMEAPGTIMRRLQGFGEMEVVCHERPQGTDFTALLKGLPHE